MQELQESKSIIEQLYYLRAGLSLICECKQTIDDYDKDKKAIERKTKTEVEELSKSIAKKKEKLEELRRKVKSEQQRADKATGDKAGSGAKAFFLFILLAGLGFCEYVALVLLGCVTNIHLLPETKIVVAITEFFGNTYQTFGPFFGFVIGILLSLGSFALPGLIFYIIVKVMTPFWESVTDFLSSKSTASAYAGDVAKATQQIKTLEEEIQRDEAQLPARIEQAKKIGEASLETLTKTRGGKRQEAIEIMERTYQALVNVSVIDRRDWAVLDLIIFALETGRADTLKEALQVADQERRSNTLIEAVDRANAEIVKAIHVSAKQTQGVIRRAMSSLSSSVATMTSSVTKSVRGLASSVQSGFAQMEETQREQLIAQQTQIALQRRANWNSQRLVEMMDTAISMDGSVRIARY